MKIEKIRKIVETGQYEKIDGQYVDLFTASVILRVYNALDEGNREKFASLPIRKMAIFAYKCL